MLFIQILALLLTQCARSHSFPSISKPTRMTIRSCTCIDNIFTNVIEKPILPGILYSDLSDHFPIFQITDFLCPTFNTIKSVKSKHVEIDFHSLLGELGSKDWSSVTEHSDANGAYNVFIEELTNLTQRHSHERSLPSKSRAPRKPWITKGILKSICKKQRLYRRYLKTKSMSSKRKYTIYRNRLNYIIRESRKAYYGRQLELNCANLKCTWNILRNLLGKTPSKLPSHVSVNGKKIADPKVIANAFNSYFVNSGRFDNTHTNGSFHDYLGNNLPESLFLLPTDRDEILKVNKQMKSKHSSGLDGFSPFFTKKIIHCITEPLCHIFNTSFSSGIFPDAMKVSKVIPVFKKGNSDELSNYRPISLLSSFSKILERLMYNRLYTFLDKHCILIPQQFGFRQNHSTETALIYASDLLYNYCEKNEFALGLYVDLSKAFDCLDHRILLHKLDHYGIRGTALDWFRSYLSNRRQLTRYNGTDSDVLRVNRGVPQGSILGPLLFLLFINDIVNSSASLQFVLYADDTNIFFSHNNLQCLLSHVQTEMQNVTRWFQVNKLQINKSKTKYMIFNFKERGRKLPTNLNLQIENEVVEQVEYTNFLGVIIDNKLSWEKHIASVSNKISSSIGILRKLKSVLPSETLFTLYRSLIHPHLSYCSLVWGRTYKRFYMPLFILQKRAVRLCCNEHRRANTSPLFKSLHLLKLPDLITHNTLLFMYKFKCGLLPSVFSDFFPLTSAIHSVNTRGKNKFYVPRLRTSFLQRNSIRYQGPVHWNAVNPLLIIQRRVGNFKALHKKTLLANY